MSNEALDTITENANVEQTRAQFALLDAQFLGVPYEPPSALCDFEDKYLQEDFDEIDGFFQAGLRGESKAPAALLILLYQERKKMRREIRRRRGESETE